MAKKGGFCLFRQILHFSQEFAEIPKHFIRIPQDLQLSHQGVQYDSFQKKNKSRIIFCVRQRLKKDKGGKLTIISLNLGVGHEGDFFIFLKGGV